MYLKFLFVFVLTIFFSNELKANAPDQPPKKWPCDQVYNPKINLKAIWQGPDISEYRKWWKDDDVIEVVNQLSDPILNEEEGVRIINEFAKKHTFFWFNKKIFTKRKITQCFCWLIRKSTSEKE